MNKKIAYLLIAVLTLSFVAAVGFATHVVVYDPIEKRNVAIERVSMDQLKAWMSTPAFSRWTNMDALEEYLAEEGVDIDQLMEEARGLDKREVLSLTGSRGVFRQWTSYEPDSNAVTDIECDLDDRELSFELTNVGDESWYLVDQELTVGRTQGETGRKVMSDAHTSAKEVKLWINGFLANSYLGKYWMGEKLFYPEGQTFADACGADFLRAGRTVECELEPIPLRSGALMNSYRLNGPGFSERGTFECS